MDTIVQEKLVQIIPEGTIPVINEYGERAFDFKGEGTGIFLYMKCYCSRKQRDGKNYKIVKICLTDVIRQIWSYMSDQERLLYRKMIIDGIANDCRA